MTSEQLKIDKRIVERNIKHGRLDAAEYERMLSALPDLSDKVWRKPLQASEPAVSAAPPVSAAESEPPSAPAPEVPAALGTAAPATFYSQG